MAKKKGTVKEFTEEHNGLYIPAGIFLGLGIGSFFGDPGAGLLTGMGAGFLAMAILKH